MLPTDRTQRFQITVEGQPGFFLAGADQTLLQAALQAGTSLSSSCRNGSCRACICKLLAGRIEHLIEWPGLSREEKQEGWILPCVALPRSDIVLQWPQQAG